MISNCRRGHDHKATIGLHIVAVILSQQRDGVRSTRSVSRWVSVNDKSEPIVPGSLGRVVGEGLTVATDLVRG